STPPSPPFPYTTLFRSARLVAPAAGAVRLHRRDRAQLLVAARLRCHARRGCTFLRLAPGNPALGADRDRPRTAGPRGRRWSRPRSEERRVGKEGRGRTT